MKSLSVSEAKNSFGEILDLSKREPVCIKEEGLDVAVLLSMEEYERLNELEDQWWAIRAVEAAKNGFIGAEESAALVGHLLNARD